MEITPDIHFIDVIDSTNREMWRWTDAGHYPGEFTVLHAGMQTGGRGLGNTSWESEAGENLLFSVFLKPVFLLPSKQFLLNKAITLGIRDALATICRDASFLIKWPNDIYTGNAKIAGTLIENRITGKTLQASVAGTGVNINQKSFPQHIPNPVSLSNLSGISYDITEVLQAILQEIIRFYFALKQGRQEMINNDYLNHLYGYEKTMTYIVNGQRFEAQISGVNQHGKLQLRNAGGNISEYGMKEVEMIV